MELTKVKVSVVDPAEIQQSQGLFNIGCDAIIPVSWGERDKERERVFLIITMQY